jgi:hypothetical protein
MIRSYHQITFAIVFAIACSAFAQAAPGIVSFDTGHTITKVRTAKHGERTMIIGSSYEGAILALSDTGKPLWKNDLSGIMNHDLWCEDISGDGNDEVLAANADGHVYCLSTSGRLLWKFRANDAPMYSVCVLQQASSKSRRFKMKDLQHQVDGFGYRVLQTVELPEEDSFKFLILYGRQIVLVPVDLDVAKCEVVQGKYSYNDIWNDRENSRVFLASCQSGGTCISN